MRALSPLLLAGAVGLGGLVLAPATAEADGGWRGRDYYSRLPAPPPQRFYGYGYGYAPRPYYGPPQGYYGYGPSRGYFGYGPPRGYYGYGRPPLSYGIPPGPGVGLFSGPRGFYGGPPVSYGVRPGPGVGLFIR